MKSNRPTNIIMNSTTSLKSHKGFTLIETLVALAIGAVLAALFIPELTKMMSSSNQAAALTHQANIQDHYSKWVTLGATHPTSASTDLTLAILTVLASPGDDTISSTPNYFAVGGDAQAIREPRSAPPLPGAIRLTMPGTPPAIETINGTAEVVYNSKFIFRFTPTSAKSGTWTVTTVN